MSTKVAEFICTLRDNSDCSYCDYQRSCTLVPSKGFVVSSCPYRLRTVVIMAAKAEESPVPVVQQPQPKSADEMQKEAEEAF